jgi:Family of unknown function (DUF6082)
VNGPRPTRVVTWIAIATVAVALVLLSGLGLVALVAPAASPEMWSRWSNAGQAFGVLTAVFSGFALAALVITFLMQLQELKAQRIELCQQRDLLGQAQSALYRSAEADIRGLHVDLIKLAIADPDLADVWPALRDDIDVVRNRQYLYANLILQHTWLNLKILELNDDEVRSRLGYLFTSPLINEYWNSTQASRAGFLIPGSSEFDFTQLADTVFEGSTPTTERPPPRIADQDAA